MAEKTSSSITINAPAARIMDVIADFPAYPQWAQGMHVAEVTEIDADFEGDTPAPILGPEWRETARERHVSANGLAYAFVTYHNTSHGEN